MPRNLMIFGPAYLGQGLQDLILNGLDLDGCLVQNNNVL